MNLNDALPLVGVSVIFVSVLGEIRNLAIKDVRDYFKQNRPSQFKKLPCKREMYANPRYWGKWTLPAWDKWLKEQS